MNKFWRLSLVSIVCLSCFSAKAQLASRSNEPFVYGAKPVLGDDAPWQAAIYLANRGASSGLLCGASVIAPNWVVTAAHCFYNNAGDRIPTVLLGVTAGTLRLSKSKQDLRIDEVKFIEGFQPGDWGKDIALVKLNRSVGKDVPSMILASDDDEKSRPLSYNVAGWGKTETVAISDNLLFATINPVAQTDCAKSYPSGLSAMIMCAGALGKDACHGDSGGPLYTGKARTAVQYGVVVAGDGCGKVPGVYARVSQHRAWIQQVISATNDKLNVAGATGAGTCTRQDELEKRC